MMKINIIIMGDLIKKKIENPILKIGYSIHFWFDFDKNVLVFLYK